MNAEYSAYRSEPDIGSVSNLSAKLIRLSLKRLTYPFESSANIEYLSWSFYWLLRTLLNYFWRSCSFKTVELSIFRWMSSTLSSKVLTWMFFRDTKSQRLCNFLRVVGPQVTKFSWYSNSWETEPLRGHSCWNKTLLPLNCLNLTSSTWQEFQITLKLVQCFFSGQT